MSFAIVVARFYEHLADRLVGGAQTAFADAGYVHPKDPTRHFIMLRDGAMVAGYLDGSEQAAETFTRGVDGLLRYAQR